MKRPSEVARLLNVDVKTVQRWCRDGMIEHVRLPGGDYRIPDHVVDRLMAPAGADCDAR